MKNHHYLAYSSEEELIQSALRCLESRIKYHPEPLDHSNKVRDYLRLQLAAEKNEVFAAIFLDNKHRILAFEKLFFGTINQTVVHERRVAQKVLEHNAAAIIFAHNHPSGTSEPSDADKNATQRLIQALAYFDVRVLDHFVVSHNDIFSFAEYGLI